MKPAKNLSAETERVRRIWNNNAPKYDRQIALMEKWLFKDGREWIGARTSGNVLEVAIGTGRNLPFYPLEVRLIGVDLSPEMLKIARRRADELGINIDLREGDAHQLAFADSSFDSVVCALSLCNIPDERRAVAEMKRVLRPGGRLLLLDHVRGSSPVIRGLQRVLEVPALWFGGDHLLRRPYEHVVTAGFEIEEHERYKWGVVERLMARKPFP